MKFVTAFGALINYGRLPRVDTVIAGVAACNVGLTAIQAAKMMGATKDQIDQLRATSSNRTP
jgi:NADPH:quinone reductase